MDKYEYTTELIDSFTEEGNSRLILEFPTEFNDIVDILLNSLDIELEIDTHWRSSQGHVDYSYEPFLSDGFYIRKFVFSNNEKYPSIKLQYVAFEFSKLMNKLIDLEKDFLTKSFTDNKHTKVKAIKDE